MWFIAREHTQAEYSWIAQFGAGGARQYAMVVRVRLAGMELAQPAGLACAGAGLRWRLFCHHHLTPVGGIDRRHLIDLHSL